MEQCLGIVQWMFIDLMTCFCNLMNVNCCCLKQNIAWLDAILS